MSADANCTLSQTPSVFVYSTTSITSIREYYVFLSQQEASTRQSRLEQEQKTMAEALTSSERKAAEERGD